MSDGFDAVEDLGHLGRSADEDLLAVGDRLLGVQCADRLTHECGLVVVSRRDLHPGLERGADEQRVQLLRGLHHLFGCRDEVGRDTVLHHRAVREDGDEQVVARLEVDELGTQDVAWAWPAPTTTDV